jgi:ATP-dependent helicase YprA (DUF1998 family)
MPCCYSSEIFSFLSPTFNHTQVRLRQSSSRVQVRWTKPVAISKSRCMEEELQRPGVREEIEARLLDNRLKLVVATTALGMGFDKPDLGFLIHHQLPGSVIHYCQRVGRADPRRRRCWLDFAGCDGRALRLCCCDPGLRACAEF